MKYRITLMSFINIKQALPFPVEQQYISMSEN